MLQLLASLFCLTVLPMANQGGPGGIQFVETSVDLRADGSAVVLYAVQWAVVRGEMHGFYFEGNDRLVVERFDANSYALDNNGQRYDLSISEVSRGRWDIVLAGGQGVSSGTLTFFFSFQTNFKRRIE